MARMMQMKDVGVSLRKIQNPSTIRLNLEKNPIPQEKLKLGKKLKFEILGKITAINQDEFGKSCSIDISKCDHEEEDEDEQM
jgi:hypothetical protein